MKVVQKSLFIERNANHLYILRVTLGVVDLISECAYLYSISDRSYLQQEWFIWTLSIVISLEIQFKLFMLRAVLALLIYF